MADELIAEQAGSVVTLTLNRPERRNAVTPELITQFVTELERIDADQDTRCVVITGAESAFCAGYDIDRIDSAGSSETGSEARRVEQLCSRLRSFRLPVVAKVNGVASGTGCDLAVSCDVRFASDNARFAMPPAKLGILYDPGGMRRLTQIVGPANAKEMLFTGSLIDAQHARDIGLVNRVVGAADLDREADRFVESIVVNAPLSIWAAKLAVNAIVDEAPLSRLAHDELAAASSRVWASGDAIEGPQAFREKRPPEFTGT